MDKKDDGVADSNEKEDRVGKDEIEKKHSKQVTQDIDREIERWRDRMSRAVDEHMRITIETLQLSLNMTKQLPGATQKSASQLLSTTQEALQASRWDLPSSIDAFLKGNLPEELAARAEQLTRVLWQGVELQYTTFWE